MAFVDQKTREGRVPTVVAVAALQGAAIIGLIHGLSVAYDREVLVPFEARNIPAEPPPEIITPPPPQPKEQAQQPNINAPETWLDMPRRDPTFTVPNIPDIPLPNLPDIPDIGHPAPPVPDIPKATIKPVGVAPLGNPGTWVSSNDYPTRDIRQGNEGTVGFRLSIGANGKVTGCTVTRSSGHPGLDAATCKFVTRRAEFSPASDGTGAKVAGTYSNRVKWVIPK